MIFQSIIQQIQKYFILDFNRSLLFLPVSLFVLVLISVRDFLCLSLSRILPPYLCLSRSHPRSHLPPVSLSLFLLPSVYLSLTLSPPPRYDLFSLVMTITEIIRSRFTTARSRHKSPEVPWIIFWILSRRECHRQTFAFYSLKYQSTVILYENQSTLWLSPVIQFLLKIKFRLFPHSSPKLFFSTKISSIMKNVPLEFEYDVIIDLQ